MFFYTSLLIVAFFRFTVPATVHQVPGYRASDCHESPLYFRRNGNLHTPALEIRCNPVEIPCSTLPAKFAVDMTLRFDQFPRNCTFINPKDTPCVFSPPCAKFRSIITHDAFHNTNIIICVGVLKSTQNPPIRKAKVAPVKSIIKDLNSFIEVSTNNISINTLSNPQLDNLDFHVVCFYDDPVAKFVPKILLDQLNQTNVLSSNFVSVDTSTELAQIFLNYHPNLQNYLNSKAFPLPIAVPSGYNLQITCNTTAPSYQQQIPAFDSKFYFVINGYADDTCDDPLIIPPYYYCMDYFYGSSRRCPRLTPPSIAGAPNFRMYTRWYLRSP
uniref:Uncharacterized protein n=1 Tax=Culex pseudovishnui negev-like virus TaxID=2682815 RepID=A0A6F8PYF5_9VIRU|nr:hypothetical protein 1 [Culex pseudovishnui negev-like virus]